MGKCHFCIFLFTSSVCFLPVFSGQGTDTKYSECVEQVVSTKSLITADPSLQYIFAIFRHGIRTSFIDNPPSQLTDVGKRQMYEVGKKLKTRYANFLGDYSEDKVNVTSTQKSRTIESALSVMAGLFPPDPPILSDLRWQPIPVVLDENMDKSYLLDDAKLAHQVCPKLGELLLKGHELIFQPDLRPENKAVYELLQKYTGKNETTLADATAVFDKLHFDCLNGRRIPEWATKAQPRLNNRPLHPDALVPLWLEYNLNYEGYNEIVLNLVTGPFFKRINEDLANPPGKIHYHSSHDSILFPLLWALQVDDGSNVEPGDGILFELHEVDNSSIVRIFYYHALVHRVTELESPLCPSPCSLEDFSSNFPGLNDQQWRWKCRKYC